MKLSVVILTFKRKKLLLDNLTSLVNEVSKDIEIIVVDNHSQQNVLEGVTRLFPLVKVISLIDNCGTEGRNIGIKKASGEVVICLDDDVFNLTKADVDNIISSFKSNRRLGALCFKVLHAESKKVINWSHHCDKDLYAGKSFFTDEITEGAVAVNRKAFLAAGGYPASFFISHEGPELAIRLMNRGYDVKYTPQIQVLHHQSTLGRPGWRRYYYDTRNTIWLAVRNYPAIKGCWFAFIQLSAMLVYSVRDGYGRYWVKGVFDGVKGLSRQLTDRERMKGGTINRLAEIAENNEPILKKIRRRFFVKKVSI